VHPGIAGFTEFTPQIDPATSVPPIVAQATEILKAIAAKKTGVDRENPWQVVIQSSPPTRS
jgi:hypothetical protein